ncbi:hypothetical protein [Mycobacterium sp.]|nr:hypothetical protein [Mycobacterium sp.]HME48054.1 hypothetical protein [Mycobacterium sp.]
MRVLLSEASGLTARETLTVLGRGGVHAEALSASPAGAWAYAGNGSG